ncbi:hypothetical protein ES703_65420 [subsurface metagenome]
MRFGPLEIILIIVVIIAVAVIARIIRTSSGTSESNKDTTTDVTTTPTGDNSGKLRSLFNRTGIALIIGGIVFLLAAAAMFRYAFQSYALSFIIIAVGFIIVFLLRRKR